jgi:DNA-binding transcriptional LysR family regulator
MNVKNRAYLGQVSDADLRLLRVFQTVVECGGMASAELELNIATSTISRHVKDLETRLGLTLCRRGRGGFSLTAEGQRVHDEARQLLASTDLFRASIDDLHQRMGGALHVAVFDKTASNPASRIAHAVTLFCRMAPDVALNLHVGSIQTIERGVLNGQFQLGVIPEHRRSASLAYDPLFGETMQLYCAPGHPLFEADDTHLTWDDVRALRFAGLGYHSPNMEATHRERLTRSATGFDQESVATLILSGAFIGFLPDHYAKGFVTLQRMRALRPALFFYECGFTAITRRSPAPARAAQWLHQCFVQAHGAGV